jgi:sulfoxide reductase heme-binding subunit YedZ
MQPASSNDPAIINKPRIGSSSTVAAAASTNLIANLSQEANGAAMTRAALTKYGFWIVLAAPAAVLLAAFWARSEDVLPGDFLQPTGEWAARLLILALVLTPLSQLLPASRIVRWLVRHRRAIGLAAFGYSLLHLAFYVLEMGSLVEILGELELRGIWTGWLAFLFMAVPALVSNDAAMRRLKAGWKRLQRLAYPAAILTLVHWGLVHDDFTAALANFAPLILLQLIRLMRFLTIKTPQRSTT